MLFGPPCSCWLFYPPDFFKCLSLYLVTFLEFWTEPLTQSMIVLVLLSKLRYCTVFSNTHQSYLPLFCLFVPSTENATFHHYQTQRLNQHLICFNQHFNPLGNVSLLLQFATLKSCHAMCWMSILRWRIGKTLFSKHGRSADWMIVCYWLLIRCSYQPGYERMLPIIKVHQLPIVYHVHFSTQNEWIIKLKCLTIKITLLFIYFFPVFMSNLFPNPCLSLRWYIFSFFKLLETIHGNSCSFSLFIQKRIVLV